LGIPCIYYGTEQSLSGPDPGQEVFLPTFGGNDAFLRETMFGPQHPRKSGLDGLGPAGFDNSLPGFGAFGTTGAHCFDPTSPAYVRIAALIKVRNDFPVLRYGRQYQRPISNFGFPFAMPPAGELIAWSRILDDEEALCIVNGHGNEARGGDVVVDVNLNSPSAPGEPFHGVTPFLTVIANSAQAAAGGGFTGRHSVGDELPVKNRNGSAFVEIRDMLPSEVVVLTNRP
jgi:hypothetical protein